jgi:hypothetical protein
MKLVPTIPCNDATAYRDANLYFLLDSYPNPNDKKGKKFVFLHGNMFLFMHASLCYITYVYLIPFSEHYMIFKCLSLQVKIIKCRIRSILR